MAGNNEQSITTLFDDYLKRFGEPFPAQMYDRLAWSGLVRRSLREGRVVQKLQPINAADVV